MQKILLYRVCRELRSKTPSRTHLACYSELQNRIRIEGCDLVLDQTVCFSCPRDSFLHYYSCCDDNPYQCCFHFETWAIENGRLSVCECVFVCTEVLKECVGRKYGEGGRAGCSCHELSTVEVVDRRPCSDDMSPMSRKVGAGWKEVPPTSFNMRPGLEKLSARWVNGCLGSEDVSPMSHQGRSG
ncbi:unnamed protein product [Heligmosomoides polygyrus]|uniref:Uncharacterized protein n=1 Tax=Heligmosomoides polygyrus TaxID=6339 RepID=A0A183F3X8_HELPZ|nr:unnamed protein product [Heligmosomoides polygyrus]